MKKSFTLVEILVVITIIVLLTSTAIVTYATFLKQSRDAKRKADLGQIQSSLEMYRDDNGTYPFLSSSLAPTYIRSVPKDPKTNLDYPFFPLPAGCMGTFLSPCDNYSITSTLESTSETYTAGPYGVSTHSPTLTPTQPILTSTPVLPGPTSTPIPLAGNTHYVSPSGNDGNSGSQTSPWRTIQKAANTLNSGETVIVLAGSYGEEVSISRSGIIFQASGSVNTKGFYITGNNTTVTGFTIDDTPENGIEVRGSNSIIKNNVITRSRNAGIFISGQNNLIENNDISRIIQSKPHSQGGDANCFTFFGSGHTFKGNYCHDIYSDGVMVTDAHIDAFQTWNWTSMGGVGHDVIFEKNVLMYPLGGKGWNLEEGAYNITIKNNVILAGLIVLIIDGNNISFLNNTFVGTSDTSDGLHISRTTTSIYNNIFAHQRQRVIENINSSSTITASNNCYMDYGIMLPANPGDIKGTNALFVNESARDYHLQSGSPCINKGKVIANVTDDIDGISRPQGSGYDMGVYER